MDIDLQKIKARDDVIMVEMDKVKMARWSSKCQFVATEALNGCTGLAIISPHGCILAHIAPRSERNNGDQHLRILMQDVISTFNTGKGRGIFEDSNSIVLAATFQGGTALPDAISVVDAVLQRLKLQVQHVTYPVLSAGEPRSPGQTSMIIRGRKDQQPLVYVNDTLLGSKQAEGSAKASRSASFSVSSNSIFVTQAQQAQAAYLRMQQQGLERTVILQQLTRIYQSGKPGLSWDEASKHISSMLSYATSR